LSRIGRDHAYRKVRERILATAQVCEICGRRLDFDAPPRSSRAPSVDHRLPISRTTGLDQETRRRLAVDPANLRACHVGCNSKRGNRRRRQQHISRTWT